MRRLTSCAIAAVFAAMPCLAQGPRGADTLSPGAVRDSQIVLRSLHARVANNPLDTAAWYQRGVVAWALSDRARAKNPPRSLEWTSLRRMADTSLRRATYAAPNNPLYKTMLGRFLLTSGHQTARAMAPPQFSKARTVALKGADSAARAETNIDLGRVHWRKYDAYKDRRMVTNDAGIERTVLDATQAVVKNHGILGDLGDASMPKSAGAGIDAFNSAAISMTPLIALADVRDMIRRATMALPASLNGAADYEKASSYFREGYVTAPANPRAFHSVAMVLSDSNRWPELERFSRTHISSFPWDAAAWMSLGLALHRERRDVAAHAAFDTAMAYLAPAERERLTDLTRILPPRDSAAFAVLSDDQRSARHVGFWLGADPLWSQAGNETHLEFLSRVVRRTALDCGRDESPRRGYRSRKRIHQVRPT